MSGLIPDFSPKAVRARVLANSAGLPPHERPGHLAPTTPTQRDVLALSAIDTLRHPPDEEIGI